MESTDLPVGTRTLGCRQCRPHSGWRHEPCELAVDAWLDSKRRSVPVQDRRLGLANESAPRRRAEVLPDPQRSGRRVWRADDYGNAPSRGYAVVVTVKALRGFRA